MGGLQASQTQQYFARRPAPDGLARPNTPSQPADTHGAACHIDLTGASAPDAPAHTCTLHSHCLLLVPRPEDERLERHFVDGWLACRALPTTAAWMPVLDEQCVGVGGERVSQSRDAWQRGSVIVALRLLLDSTIRHPLPATPNRRRLRAVRNAVFDLRARSIDRKHVLCVMCCAFRPLGSRARVPLCCLFGGVVDERKDPSTLRQLFRTRSLSLSLFGPQRGRSSSSTLERPLHAPGRHHTPTPPAPVDRTSIEGSVWGRSGRVARGRVSGC